MWVSTFEVLCTFYLLLAVTWYCFLFSIGRNEVRSVRSYSAFGVFNLFRALLQLHSLQSKWMVQIWWWAGMQNIGICLYSSISFELMKPNLIFVWFFRRFIGYMKIMFWKSKRTFYFIRRDTLYGLQIIHKSTNPS